MNITGQQLRVIVKREAECWQEIDRLMCLLGVATGKHPEELRALSDALAEIQVYRNLIDDNTMHTGRLAYQTVSELADHE